MYVYMQNDLFVAVYIIFIDKYMAYNTICSFINYFQLYVSINRTYVLNRVVYDYYFKYW